MNYQQLTSLPLSSLHLQELLIHHLPFCLIDFVAQYYELPLLPVHTKLVLNCFPDNFWQSTFWKVGHCDAKNC
jgi:hypothetical protein